MLARLAEAQTGESDLRGLLEAVVATRLGFQQEIESFRVHWLDLAEAVEPEASPLEKSLVDLYGLLGDLQAALVSGASQDCGGWIARLRPPLDRLRQLRRQLETSPTANLSVNRLLRRLDRWLQGSAVAPSTRSLLEGLPTLEDHWDAVIAQVEPEQQEGLWALLDPAIEALCAWRDALDGGPSQESAGWPAQVEQGVRAFESSLASQVQREVAGGPTPFAVINLLVRTLDEQGANDAVLGLAQAASQLLALQIPADTLAVSQLPDTLARLSQGAEVRDELIERSLQLARLHSAETRDVGLVDVRSGESGLPPMLEGLQQLAAEVVSGRLEGSALTPGIAQLEGVIARFSAARQPSLQLAVLDLQETAAALRDLQVSPGRGLLLEVRELLENCAQSLGAL